MLTPAPSAATPTGTSTRRATAVDAAEARALVRLALELAGLFVLMRLLRIESPAFYERVAPMAFGGAVVNHLLPARWRLGFFALLSMATIWLVFGLVQGTWIVGIGMGLIALCHLPAPFAVRVGLLLTAGGVLAAMRAEWIRTPWSGAIWAIVGSMFMFRLIVYVYDLRHLKQRTTWEQRLAYFFCLPNVTFPLFPVLDFATFRRTYYDRPALEIYREGVRWIVRGMVHLILYRWVYQYLTLSPAEVRSGADFVQYAVANYGLYLRVSGQFHLIVGLLHLFGFRLPETHRFFYLASSFSDLWRRINIYWKDFMQKVFYMPLFFALMRRHGETVAMVAATAVVFVVTWFFHSYQWFWLLGTWLWSTTDTLFWALLGLCLIANSLWEARKGRVRTVGKRPVSVGALLRHGAQTAVMFAVMAMLWTLWTSPTLGDLGAMLRAATMGPRDLAVLTAVLGGVALVAAVAYRRALTPGALAGASQAPSLAGMAGLAFVAFGSSPATETVVPSPIRNVMIAAREPQLNKRDQDELQRGYYEKIVGVNRFNGELWNVFNGQEERWVRLKDLGALRDVPDVRLEELIPGQYPLNRTTLTVNSDGLRDREYERAKPAGVLRVAVLGQSYVMGSGVEDNETFENLLEDRLTKERAQALGVARVELVNFGAPSYSALQQRALMESGRVAAYAPDVVLVVGHRTEIRLIADQSLKILERPEVGALPGPLAELVPKLGITTQTPREEAQRLMEPHAVDVIAWIYGDIVARAHAAGARAVYAYIPTPTERVDRHVRTLERAVRQAGFDALLDLRDVYAGVNQEALIVAPWDRHPNAEGHRRIARRLFELFDAEAVLVAPAAPATTR